MMRCPACHVNLVKKLIAGGGVFWVCPECDGRAATLPLLRRLITPECIRALWQQASTEGQPAHRACPCCEGRMKEISGETSRGTVFLDICPHCQLLWFDQGELATLPQVPPPEPEAELPQKARERLALLKVEEIRQQDQWARGWPDDAAPNEWWLWLPGLIGLPVELDQSPLKQLPWCTWILGLLILGLSLFGFYDHEYVVQTFGLIPAQAGRYYGLTLLSSFFLHGRVIHLLINLYFFLTFADNIEDFLGKGRFLLLLLVATLSGNLLHILGDPQSTIPCIGASGAISGLLAFYALQFPHRNMGVFVPRRNIGMYRLTYSGSWLRMPILLWFGFWVLIQCFGAWLQLQSVSTVSALAHLGGAAAGALFWFWGRQSIRK